MGLSSANSMLQEAYHKLQWTTVEKEKIIEKLAVARITPPNEEKFTAFCNIYASYQDKMMQSYEARTTNVFNFLNNQLEKIQEIRREILKEIHDDKQRIEQAEFDQEEHLRALKLEEDEIQHYKQMQEKLERDYQAWKAQQEEVRKERERLLAVMHTVLNELFLELLQSDKMHEFLFDGTDNISINFSDVYRQIEDITRNYFNLTLHKEDYIEQRETIIRQIVSDEIDAIILKRPRSEHNRLLARKEPLVVSETNKLVNAIAADMREKSAYDRTQEAHKSLSDNYGTTYVKQVKKKVEEVEEVVSKEEEVVSKEEEVVSKEEEVVNKEKEVISEKQEIVSEAKEVASEEKIKTNQEEEKTSSVKVEEKEIRSKTIIESLAQKTKEQSSGIQIMHAFSESQMSREKTNSQATGQHMKDITDFLKDIKAEEKKSPDAKTEATKTDIAKILPQKSLFSTSKAPSKNDSVFNGEPPQASTASARRRRF